MLCHNRTQNVLLRVSRWSKKSTNQLVIHQQAHPHCLCMYIAAPLPPPERMYIYYETLFPVYLFIYRRKSIKHVTVCAELSSVTALWTFTTTYYDCFSEHIHPYIAADGRAQKKLFFYLHINFEKRIYMLIRDKFPRVNTGRLFPFFQGKKDV